MFYEIRKDESNLVKIRVSGEPCKPVSNSWEIKRVGFSTSVSNYIGPKTEMNEMINKLKQYVESDSDDAIVIVEE